MITDHFQAADEIAELFRVAAAAQSPAWLVAWPNMDFQKPAPSVAVWARWTLTHTDGQQRTLAGPDGLSRHSKSGIVSVELFTPLGKGVKAAYDAAQIVLGAYEGKRTPSDVWFRNARIADDGEGQGGDKGWWSTLVIVDFTYDNLN